MSNIIIPTDGLKEKFDEQLQEFKNSIKSPNVLLLGQTGVGKSSLVNTIFGEKLASISDIKPETRGFHVYNNSLVPVNIIDSEGYELANPEEFKKSLIEFIEKNFSEGDKQIHICWYCISISSARVLPYDLDNLEFLTKEKHIPTCVVFTQCDNDTPEGSTAKSLSEVIGKKFGRHIPFFQTSNDPEINKELGDIERLIEWSINNLNDDNLKAGFIIAQKACLNKKEERANNRIKYYALVAAGIGASPIPMSDAILLTGLQVKMASDIFSFYGLDAKMSDTIKNIIGGRVISMLGKTVAGNLLKLIPGFGQTAGAVINAGVASSITYALGYALVQLTKKAIETEWSGDTKLLETLFSEEMINKYVDEYQKNHKQINK